MRPKRLRSLGSRKQEMKLQEKIKNEEYIVFVIRRSERSQLNGR